jgi:hypothetical protein
MRTEIAVVLEVINLACQIYAGNDGITINLANSPNHVTVRNANSQVITNSKCGVNKNQRSQMVCSQDIQIVATHHLCIYQQMKCQF